MIRELTIENYKSILDHTIELGRINVFIGENGCGKTNILEAAAMAAAAVTNKLEVEELWNRGIRVAKPSITFSSFAGISSKEIVFRCTKDSPSVMLDLRLTAKGVAMGGGWFVKGRERTDSDSESLGADVEEAVRKARIYGDALDKEPVGVDAKGNAMYEIPAGALSKRDATILNRLIPVIIRDGFFTRLIGDFVVYNIGALALRGLQVVSRRTPLGIHGENLHSAIAALEPEVWADILARAKCVSWIDDIVVEPADAAKYQGHKLLQSESTLYFHDRFMRRRNNVFSAENVNEGILHVLFYLTLFASKDTPRFFGVDNIETALNPQLCRNLVAQLAELSAQHDKQALITTHNPAILDGLNLHDDEQRLFVVSRSDDGHTRTRRIKVKPEAKGAKYKLSELWMRGHLGGIPERF